MRQGRGNDAFRAEQFESLLDQRNGTIAVHRLGKQLASEPEVLSPPTFTELVRAPDFVQVLIQGVITLSIKRKSRRWNLYLIGDRQKDTGRDASEILPGPSGETQDSKLNRKSQTVMMTPPLVNQVEILLREGIVASDLTIGEIRRNLHERVALFRGQIG